MTYRIYLCLLVAGLPGMAVAIPLAADEPATAKIDFNRDIRPLLSKSCFACHGSDEESREAGLRLDARGGALQQLESEERAIVPGKPEQSELISRITSDDEDLIMPPKEGGEPLSEEQIALIRLWISQGAAYADHWSFTPPLRPRLPAVADSSRLQNGIDYFVQSRLKESGMKYPAASSGVSGSYQKRTPQGAGNQTRQRLKSSPRADRYTLIRRLSLDLRGLPPTPAEVDAYLADSRPDAYESIVDQFLNDSAYGERWARMWLDLARFADSKGYGSDPLRTIWLYRDWVIDAFNRNLPYDQFTIEQLAGDLLPEPTRDQIIATAFHRNTMTNTEGGTDDEEFRVAAVRDRIDTTVQVWMGLTMGCGKCHSHKYDPITQREYYQFYAYFNQTADNDQPSESPTLEVAPPKVIARKKQIDAQIGDLKKQLEKADEAGKKLLKQQIAELEKSRPSIPTVPVMQELTKDKHRETYIMIKGSFLSRGETVSSGIPQSFHAFPANAPQNRLGVAYWLIDKSNPLTARVAVNRFWAQMFGIGLVETEEDFGTQGEPPSHPRLLDWLAHEFMDSNWDMKALIKLIVTSETYRQSSKVLPQQLQKDPRNRLLSRGPRFRLEAEMVRDQALAISGLLSRKSHGPSVFPPQPPGLWRAAFNGRDRKWATSTGEDRYRRALYTFWRRTVPYPSMATFDAPSRELCTVRRIPTNTPLQAFVTMNDPVYVEAAQALARRIVGEGGSTTEERIAFAVKLCLNRPPHARQVAQLVGLFQSERKHYQNDLMAAKSMATDPLGPLPDDLDAAEMAAWTVVANVLLNLDAVLTRG